MEKKIKYSTKDISVIWQPQLCQHVGNCVKMLPQVYNPAENPWIKLENATIEQIIEQINACPSGALTYQLNNEYH